MKRILVTGKSSYIAGCFKSFMKRFQGEYSVELLSVRDGLWKELDFSKYDIVIHAAGIAHVDTLSEGSKDYENIKQEYFKVNRDLTVQIAGKAKAEGVGQFIFLSSIIIYGEGRMGKKLCISDRTVPKPANYYGESKWQAEKGILKLMEEGFSVAVLRLPMVYGKGCRGNYRRLEWLASWCPVFPEVPNRRSMLKADRLCAYLKQAVDRRAEGVRFVQDEEYHCTSEDVKGMAEKKGRKLWLIAGLYPFLYVMAKKVGSLNKLFGSVYYKKEIVWELQGEPGNEEIS